MTESIQWHINNPHLGNATECWICQHWGEISAAVAEAEARHASRAIQVYGLWRNGERKADVVVLSTGKTIVAWPTSVIVYDSEQAARDVHITHMGGRGEITEFRKEF